MININVKMYRIMKQAILATIFALSCIMAGGQERDKAYAVSNAHLDTQWNWDVQTTINEYIPKTLRQNLWLIANYPDYIFNFEGAVKYSWMKEYYPLEYEKVREAIKDGRWHVSGSSWDANDTNIPSPESAFRNILLGQEFYKREFGIKSSDIFLPDCFGFSCTLPTIASHCGLIGFSTQKLTWRKHPFYGNERIPFTTGMWYGIDGSSIQSVFDCGSYVYNFPEGDLSYDADLLQRAGRDSQKTAYRYFGAGDTGGSASIWSVRAIEEAVNSGEGPVEVISAASDQIYKDYIASGRQSELPVYEGELLMDVHATGCYTSQAAMKRFNRRNEQLADGAEKASVIADWFGALPYQKEKINGAWQRFIWHQFHDDLTGTSIQRAYTFSWNDEIIAQSQFADLMRSASGAVSQAMDTRVRGVPVLVYNPAAYKRTSIVTADIPLEKVPGSISVYSPEGHKVPAQLLSFSDGKARIIFAADMESAGYAVYDVRPSSKKEVSSELKISGRSIENSVYKVALDQNGDISSIIDKRFGKELVRKGEPAGLVVFSENRSCDWPAWEILKSTLDSTPEYISENVRISIAEEGPLRATLKVEKSLGDSHFVQYISLTDGAADDRIDIAAEIDWAQENAVLKMNFPWTVSNPEALYDLGIGHIGRGNNTDTAYEVVAQHWADLTSEDGAYGIAVINDCKYGWDKPDDNTLRMTLFHNPDTDTRYVHQEIQDFGHHRIRYSIFAHEGSAVDAGIVAEGEDFNQPLVSYIAEEHQGWLGRRFSFVESSSDQIAVKALKKAEDGNGYIVRTYEVSGKEAEGIRLHFPSEIIEAYEVNGIEEGRGKAVFEGNDLIVSSGRFEPKTYRVILEKPERMIQPVATEYIHLPYNMKAISPDAFMADADIDSLGNSFSDELMPDIIVNNGIPFARGEAGISNAVRCQGQRIQLPEGDFDKVYILAAAADQDRRADFHVDDAAYVFDVPYFSDFYAQWGQDTFSEGYVKNGELAYVGNHRHNSAHGNEAYVFTYMYQLELDIDADSKEIILPDNPDIIVFAATAAKIGTADIVPAMEVRALPETTEDIVYVE